MLLSAIAIAALAAAKAVEGPDRNVFFRGTQFPSIKGHYGTLSFATSLPVAMIWSARPPDVWGRRPDAEFLPTSTVFAVTFPTKNPLHIDTNFADFGQILRALRFGQPNGLTEDEALRVYNYLHNRLIGRVRGGEFLYEVHDEDGNARDEDELPFSLMNPQTLVLMAREEFEWESTIEQAERLLADTFVFFDAPIVKKVAARLGYDAFIYADVFGGGEEASKSLFQVPVTSLEGVRTEFGLDGRVAVHDTVRPLSGDVQIVWERPARDLLESASVRSGRAS